MEGGRRGLLSLGFVQVDEYIGSKYIAEDDYSFG